MNRRKFLHPLTLLSGCVVLAAVLSYVLPSGEYDRREDPNTGRVVVIPGSFHRVERRPVGPLEVALAVPQGVWDAAPIILLVLLTGGAFTVVNKTGALERAVMYLVRKKAGVSAILVICLLFALGGALVNTFEEVIALVPVLLLFTRRMGFNIQTAMAMSLGSAAVAASFSPVNPFQVKVAQDYAGICLEASSQCHPYSGAGFRMIFLLLALAVWITGLVLYARRRRIEPVPDGAEEVGELARRDRVILAMILFSVGAYVYSVRVWEFQYCDYVEPMFFLLMGVAVGLVGRLGGGGTVRGFARGFRSVLVAAILIGVARAVRIVLEQGAISDTIIESLAAPLRGQRVELSALGMMVMHTFVHVPVPSVSGHAVLTMPILAPLSDQIPGLSRQVIVLAYQYGAGLCDLITPTNGALMAIITAFGLRYVEWLRFVLPLYLILFGIGALAVVIGIAVGL